MSSSDGSGFSDAECMEEYSVDSDGNIKPDQGAPNLNGKADFETRAPKGEEKPQLTTEEKRKAKALAKLDKRIKAVTKVHDKQKKIKIEPKEIKNKHKRQEVALAGKMERRRDAKIDKLKKQKIREEHGEEAAPKGITKTIESMRVKDETIITDADDEEIKGEQDIDEFASYFKNEQTPKILMTTNRRPHGNLFNFLKEIKSAFPGVEYYERKNHQIKTMIEAGKKRGFTDLMLWYEKRG